MYVDDLMTGTDKDEISVSIKSKMANTLQTNSTSCLDGTNSPPRDKRDR